MQENAIPIKQDNWSLICVYTNRQVYLNDTVTCFLGQKDKILGGRPPTDFDFDHGRIWTDSGEYMPTLFGLRWVDTSAESDDSDSGE